MTPRLLSFVLLPIVFLAGCSENSSHSNDSAAAVRAAWDEFKEASLSGKGAVSANRVTSGTVNHYATIRDLALNASREDLKELAIAQQITVMGMRMRLTSADLEKMSGRDLYIHAVDRGWIGKNSASDIGITDIQVTGDAAVATSTKAGKPTGQKMHFVKQEGVWKFDMMPLMADTNTAFDQIQKESGLDEEQYVSKMIEAITGRRLQPEDWSPRARN